MPAYLSRGPPVLQHPERVVPLSDCERFEPHYQPNVALAPVPTPSITPVPPPTLSSVVAPRRYHEKSKHQRSLSPDVKLDTVVIKLEKPSSSLPDQDVDYQSHSSTPDPHDTDKDNVVNVSANANVNDNAAVNNDNDNRDGDGDSGADDKAEECKKIDEEETSAVTSSTVNVDPLNESPDPVEYSSASSLSLSPSDDFDPANALIDLEERLIFLKVPQDVIALTKKLNNEFKKLLIQRRNDLREIKRLKDELNNHNHNNQSTVIDDCNDINNKLDDNNEGNNVVVDSTDNNPDANELIDKEPESGVITDNNCPSKD